MITGSTAFVMDNEALKRSVKELGRRIEVLTKDRDQWIANTREACEQASKLETKLNQIAVERDLARKERDSVSHRLDSLAQYVGKHLDKLQIDGEFDQGFLAGMWEIQKRLPVVETSSKNCGQQHDMGFTCVLPADHDGMHRGDIVWDRD